MYSPDPVDTSGAVAHTRFFNPAMGIWKDSATGTAAGPLVALPWGNTGTCVPVTVRGRRPSAAACESISPRFLTRVIRAGSGTRWHRRYWTRSTQGSVELAPLVGHLRQAYVSDARDGQRQLVGTCRRTETTLGALHLAEEVATIGG